MLIVFSTLPSRVHPPPKGANMEPAPGAAPLALLQAVDEPNCTPRVLTLGRTGWS